MPVLPALARWMEEDQALKAIFQYKGIHDQP